MLGSSTTTVSGGMDLIGVNISGGEYGSIGTGSLGTDYLYPSDTKLQYFASKGMTAIRMPFQLERLEPTPAGPLDQSQVADLQHVVAQAESLGMDVILDPHNYGSAWGNPIGSPGTPTSSFATFWGDMAAAFKGDSNVIFGLMNEPNQQTPAQQAQIDNAAISAIRQAGATQEILVPGTDWSGAWSWSSSGNAAAINPSTIHDPLNNYAFDVHQYLDSDGSGTHYGPVVDPNIGVQRLTSITQWAQQTGARLFLGEFGVAGDPQSLAAMQSMLSYMEQNSSVWQGATYWSAGQWLGSYPYSIEPRNGQDSRQMSVLQQFTPQTPDPTPPPTPPATSSTGPLQAGSGPDSIVLLVSEDAYANGDGTSDANGDAKFTVSVDGKQIGGSFIASALRSAGQEQAVTLNGMFGTGNHTVSVDFLNDAWAGTAATDRNLYVDSITANGADAGQSAALLSSGNQDFNVAVPRVTSMSDPGSDPLRAGSGPDSIVLQISEDAYANGDGTSDANGDAKFTVSVDGRQIGGSFIATALHSAGQEQTVTINGAFGMGNHTVSVDFLNDAWAGTAATDRNLYVDSITANGADAGQSAALLSSGSQNLNVAVPHAASTSGSNPLQAGSGPDSIVLLVSEDTYANGDGTSDANGDAKFTVSVDGRQIGGVFIASALHSAGQEQAVTLNGTFGTGNHTVGVDFLNDAWAGTATTDRNLYVDSITADGTNAGQSAALLSSGSQDFVIAAGGSTASPAGSAETVMAFQGYSIITTGAGDDTISIGGTGNVVNAGAGQNSITDGGSGNTIVVPSAGSGFDAVFGPVLQNGDTLDFRNALNATGWDGSAASLAEFLHISTLGSDALIGISEQSRGSVTGVLDLHGAGQVTMAALLAHAMV